MKKVVFVFGLILTFVAQPSLATDKKIFGGIEQVMLLPENITLDARLDTGAKTSSLDATEIEEFEKDGTNWVRFKVPMRKGDKVKLIPLEYPIERNTFIKARNSELNNGKKRIKRIVIKMMACVGEDKQEIAVNLTNRSRFKFRMLVGREAIVKFNGIIDPSTKNLTKPNCEQDAKS